MPGPREARAHDELLELAAIEALGALDPDDRAELAGHLRSGCGACLATLASGRRALGLLAAGAAPARPSPELRARVLAFPGAQGRAAEARPAHRAPPPRPSRTRRLFRAASVAALLLSLGASGLYVREAHQRERVLAGLLALIEEPATHVVSLAASPEAGDASARAFFAADGEIALLVQGLPPPPTGRAYQLWVIEGGAPVSAGTFVTAASGGARHTTVTQPPRAGSFVLAVTLEPAGGVPAPTGPMMLVQR